MARIEQVSPPSGATDEIRAPLPAERNSGVCRLRGTAASGLGPIYRRGSSGRAFSRTCQTSTNCSSQVRRATSGAGDRGAPDRTPRTDAGRSHRRRTTAILRPNTFIAIEDRIPLRISDSIRSAHACRVQNMLGRSCASGGSTPPTLAKNLLGSNRPSTARPRRQCSRFTLESRYSKDQILTLYLNRVYFGAGVYGIEPPRRRSSASRQNLTLPEAAMLGRQRQGAGALQSAFDTMLAARARSVLRAMEDGGFIDDATAPWRRRRDHASRAARNAERRLFRRLGHLAPLGYANEPASPLVVETTFDLDAQAEAERAVATSLAAEGEPCAPASGAGRDDAGRRLPRDGRRALL